ERSSFACTSSLFVPWFFFSSRRRHTRSKRDWSSDVCSCDLPGIWFLQLRFPYQGKRSAYQLIQLELHHRQFVGQALLQSQFSQHPVLLIGPDCFSTAALKFQLRD